MNEWKPSSSFRKAAEADDNPVVDPTIVAWFKARGAGWQSELNGVLEFYIDTVEHPASGAAPGKPSGPS